MSSTITQNNVNHPSHYTSHPSGIECIEIARHYCFSIGNAIKYLWRAGLKKDPSMEDSKKEIEDLQKAQWYIEDRINEIRKNMVNTGDYPLGAQNDSNAPYNKDLPEFREFEVLCSQTLSKITTVRTNDYTLEKGEASPNTANTDWDAAVKDQRCTPLELIRCLKNILEDKSFKSSSIGENQRKYLIEECKGWIEDEHINMENY